MPPDPVSTIGGLGSVTAIVTLWVWNAVRNVRSNFGDEYDQMRNHLKSQFRHELNQVVQPILHEVNLAEIEDGEQPMEVMTMEAIETQIDRNELADIEDQLREFDRPNELLEEVKELYDTSWREFGKASVSAFVVSGLLYTLSGDARTVLGGIVGLYAIFIAISAITSLNHARKTERQLEDMLDNYREEY